MIYGPPNLHSNETLPSYSSLLFPPESSPLLAPYSPSSSTALVPAVVEPSSSTLPARPLPIFLISPYPSNPSFIVPAIDFPFRGLPFIRNDLLPFMPFPSVSECPHFVLWGDNFYSSIPNYIPVEGGTPYSILPVVGRGPRSPCLISS
jgi:hypothetical protein